MLKRINKDRYEFWSDEGELVAIISKTESFDRNIERCNWIFEITDTKFFFVAHELEFWASFLRGLEGIRGFKGIVDA